MKDNDNTKEGMKEASLTPEEVIYLSQQAQMTYGPPQDWQDQGQLGIFTNSNMNPNMMMMSMAMQMSIDEQRKSQWISKDTWVCTCGSNNGGNFCGECGRKAPIKPPEFI